MAWTIKRTVDLQKGDLHQNGKQVGILSFPGDEDAHIWEVTVLDGGEPATLSGTVTAYFMRSFDGNSVVATGSYTGNVVSVAIPAGAYAYQGLVTAILRLTVANESTVTIDAIAFSVGENHTGTIVDPGEVIDVDAILAQYDAMAQATEDCVAATATAEGVTSIIAAAYSTTKTYAVGEYVTRSGKLYRCTTAITEPEAWTSGHWSATTVGAESRGSVMSGGSISTNAALLALTGDGSLGNLPLDKAFYISSGVHPSSSQTAIPDEPIFRFFGTVITIAQSATAKSAALQMAMLGGSTMGDELYYRRGTSTGWQPWIQVARSAFIAPVYSSSSTYAVGDYCTYNGNLYRCTTAISTAESWASGHWTQVAIGAEVGAIRNALDIVSGNQASVYSSSATYAIGDYCTYDGALYRCTTAISTAEDWTSSHWTACKVTGEVKGCLSSLPNFIQLYGLTASAEGSLSMADFPVDRCVYINSSIHPADTTKSAFSDEPVFRFTGVVFSISQTQSSMTGSLQIACSLAGDEWFYRRGFSTGVSPWHQMVTGDMLAAKYSESATYEVGDYCVYNGLLRRCKTAISTPEAWTSSHWTSVTIGAKLKELESRIAALE